MKPNNWQVQIKRRINDKTPTWFPVMGISSNTSLYPTREAARKAAAELRQESPADTFRVRRLT